MGFLDKVKSTVEQTTKAAQGKIDDVQSKRKSDQLLRELGGWCYASRTAASTSPEAEANITRLVAELRAHEAEHGPLNVGPQAAGDDGAPAAEGGSAPAPPRPAAPEGGTSAGDVTRDET
jgi:hypothetical protein